MSQGRPLNFKGSTACNTISPWSEICPAIRTETWKGGTLSCTLFKCYNSKDARCFTPSETQTLKIKQFSVEFLKLSPTALLHSSGEAANGIETIISGHIFHLPHRPLQRTPQQGKKACSRTNKHRLTEDPLLQFDETNTRCNSRTHLIFPQQNLNLSLSKY